MKVKTINREIIFAGNKSSEKKIDLLNRDSGTKDNRSRERAPILV